MRDRRVSPERCTSIEKSITLLDNKLDGYIEEFKKHEEAERELRIETLSAGAMNTEAINNLAKSQDELAKNTKGLVDAWASVNALVTIMTKVAKLIKWFGGIATGIMGIIILYKVLVDV